MDPALLRGVGHPQGGPAGDIFKVLCLEAGAAEAARVAGGQDLQFHVTGAGQERGGRRPGQAGVAHVGPVGKLAEGDLLDLFLHSILYLTIKILRIIINVITYPNDKAVLLIKYGIKRIGSIIGFLYHYLASNFIRNKFISVFIE